MANDVSMDQPMACSVEQPPAQWATGPTVKVVDTQIAQFMFALRGAET